jgi:hypothetical protein
MTHNFGHVEMHMGTPDELLQQAMKAKWMASARDHVAHHVLDVMEAHECTVETAITHLREEMDRAIAQDPHPNDDSYIADVFEPGCQMAREDMETMKRLLSYTATEITECAPEGGGH